MTIDEKKARIIEMMPSTWTDHMEFADWLMRYKNPSVVVELGVDYGYSASCFALSGIGEVYGIDWFQGDKYTGHRDTYNKVKESFEFFGFSNIHLIKMAFDDALAEWNKSIDILHIDGLHKYDAVRNDYMNWTTYLKDDGVVLIHDTCIDWFAVKDFFGEISLPKLNFKTSCGLGVVSRDIKLLDEIRNKFGNSLDSRY